MKVASTNYIKITTLFQLIIPEKRVVFLYQLFLIVCYVYLFVVFVKSEDKC